MLRFRFLSSALVLGLFLAGAAPLSAQFINFGSVVGSLSPNTPQSTSEIIRDAIGAASLLGAGGIYVEGSTRTKSSIIYPQGGYGDLFSFDKRFLWEISAQVYKDSFTETFFTSIRDTRRDRQNTRETDLRGALGYKVVDEHILKIGYGVNRVNSPSELWQFTASEITAGGDGENTQNSSGPYLGIELNFPLNKGRTLYLFADGFWYYSKGELKFNSLLAGPAYLSVIDGTATVEANSFIGLLGVKIYLYKKKYGLKLGLFGQLTASKVLTTEGIFYENGTIAPLIRLNSKLNTGIFRGIYIGFTSKI